MTLPSLIAQLKSATGGSAELDGLIFAHLNERSADEINPLCAGPDDHCIVIDGFWRKAPRYTRSLDSALTLVPEGVEWQCGWGNRVLITECAFAILDYRKLPAGKRDDAVCHAATPALALCIAALKALATLSTPEQAA